MLCWLLAVELLNAEPTIGIVRLAYDRIGLSTAEAVVITQRWQLAIAPNLIQLLDRHFLLDSLPLISGGALCSTGWRAPS